jgi:SARP family transcriptional regulator, regulator of embCAB operon
MAEKVTRIQVCGPLMVRIDGTRRDQDLPGKQGRQLAAYLAINHRRAVSRDELMTAVWPDVAPDGAQDTLATLLSRLRKALGADHLVGKSELRMMLPEGASVDLEDAAREIHRAESAVAQGDAARAWAPARAALHTANRGFLPGYDAPWIEEKRREVENLRLRALDAVAAVGLELGGAELAATERSARSLIAAAPFRESGYRYLMEYLLAREDAAEGLLVYEQLRTLLRDELGVAPSASAQALHVRLLEASGT